MKIRRPYLRFMTEPEGGEPGGEGGATPPAAENPTPDPTDPPELGDAGKKAINAMKAERDEAKRLLAEAQNKVKEFEDSQKSEAEKAAEKQAELERTAATNAAKALRYEVAEKAGLPLSAAARLQGEDMESLLSDAESLKELLGGTATATTPKPDPSQGGTGGKPQHASLSSAITAHYDQ